MKRRTFAVNILSKVAQKLTEILPDLPVQPIFFFFCVKIKFAFFRPDEFSILLKEERLQKKMPSCARQIVTAVSNGKFSNQDMWCEFGLRGCVYKRVSVSNVRRIV